MKKTRILAIHLLNDFSGSPFVFSQSLEALEETGYEIHLYTATGPDKGFLSGLKAVYHPVFYRWSKYKYLTLCYFLFSQFTLFLKILNKGQKKDIVYVNTMLPFGALVAARIKGCRIVCHIHEVSVKPLLLKKFLLFIIGHSADQCIFVSEFVKKYTPLRVPATVIYNALPLSFIKEAQQQGPQQQERFTALMLCSLKTYKGVFEFLQCAVALPNIHFELVLNASPIEIAGFFKGVPVPSNLSIYPAQKNVHAFYSRASIVLNLSLPGKWIETFGMTALEAMYYGKPVIVPPVGGIVELVENNISGFCADAQNINGIISRIQCLANNKIAYGRMSVAALERARHFTQATFRDNIIMTIQSLTRESNKEIYAFANI